MNECLKYRTFPVISLLLILCLTNISFADVVNAFITIPLADSANWNFGDDILLKLTLTDDNDDTLRVDEYQQNLLTVVELWVSGPKQNYHGVQGYTPLSILSTANGYNRNAGFDPSTGEIAVSVQDEAGPGSYTALFKVVRRVNDRNTTKYVKADFIIGQEFPTRDPYLSWTNCRSCHTPSRHSTNDQSNCIVCHSKDYNAPYQAIVHEIDDHPRAVGRCTNCHKAGAALTNFRRTACFSCHNAPGNHANYSDDDCAGCHTGNNSPYARHNISVPTQPVAFNLTNPTDDDTIEYVDSLISIDFQWQASRDNDANDLVTYRFEIDRNDDFVSPFIRDSLTQNRLTLTHNDWAELGYNNGVYWWRVKAEDLNSAGRWSTTVYSFETYWEDLPPPPENHPPSAFALISPENNGMRDVFDDATVTLIWQSSVDPDSHAVVRFDLDLVIHGTYEQIPEPWDIEVVVDSLADTTTSFDFYPYLRWTSAAGWLPFTWQVRAISGDDTTYCDTSFYYELLFQNSVDDRRVEIPTGVELLPPFPNPFNSTVTIPFVSGSAAQPTQLAIFDSMGRIVRDLLPTGGFGNPPYATGSHYVVWDASGFPAGEYIIRLEAGGKTATASIHLVR